VVAKVRERLAVKRYHTDYHMEIVCPNKLNEVEGKEQYNVEVWNRFAALEDMGTEVEMISAWETIRENI
jgi:hypothetical protein